MFLPKAESAGLILEVGSSFVGQAVLLEALDGALLAVCGSKLRSTEAQNGGPQNGTAGSRVVKPGVDEDGHGMTIGGNRQVKKVRLSSRWEQGYPTTPPQKKNVG